MSLRSKSLGSISSAAAGVLITGGTNATPIVATVTAGHQLSDGDRIAISGVTGLTAMNGIWTLSSVGATTATLVGSVGNGVFGGTAAVAIVNDRTPFMAAHTAVCVITNKDAGAVLVGTVLIEGSNQTDSAWLASPTYSSVLAPAAATAGIGYVQECTLYRYMRLRASAWTSGGAQARLLA